MPTFPKMRSRDMNDMVSIEMPAHMWLSFLSGYAASDWNSGAASAIAEIVQDALLDPIYLNERLAEAQQMQDDHAAMIHQMATGQRLYPPPNMEGLYQPPDTEDI